MPASNPSINTDLYSCEIFTLMKRAEICSSVPYPPEILRVILDTTKLSPRPKSTVDLLPTLAEEGISFFSQAFEFDIKFRAADMRALSHMFGVVRIASAYQISACLYQRTKRFGCQAT